MWSRVGIFIFLKLLGIVQDNKLTFEMHIRNIVSAIAQKTGLIRKCFKAPGNDYSVHRTFIHSFYLVLSTAHLFGTLDPIVIAGSGSGQYSHPSP